MLSNQEKKHLKQNISSNQHEVYVVSIEEMDAIVRSSSKASLPHVKNAWESIKGKTETGASYYASADDLRTLTKLVGDLGGVASKAYVKSYGGKPHIVLKGHPGLRNILTGTKYGIRNPKVIAMGLGKAGAIQAAKSGGILTLVLLTGYRVADYVLTDEATLSQFIGSLATDVVKIGITTGASIAAAALMGGFSIAVGPIFAVVAVGVGVSWLLGSIDQHLGITDRVIDGLDEMGRKGEALVASSKQEAENLARNAAASVIDYALESAKQMIVQLSADYARKYFPRTPRIF
ncbi:hypothetical protein G8770_19205 [Aestuariicella hydrocarbonica]|uniref:Uncharacterized protein n=1 Tax=Pseudomaricurvus hydrocarbonicus TaxID=1470433 RepID=A0A9E5T1P8_9GAMM|nr:hypothetical protein [Aestuariicella hydrocarbonica]NHO67680.1 hypothetical protein [Aestuariicella hydrocarbonica]